MTEIDAVEIQPDKDPIVWLNMIAGWIRSAQYDEDAALAAIEHGKTAVVNMESDNLSVVQQLEARIEWLREELKKSIQILEEYAERNPKWIFEGKEQDPLGTHALLPEARAALKESE